MPQHSKATAHMVMVLFTACTHLSTTCRIHCCLIIQTDQAVLKLLLL